MEEFIENFADFREWLNYLPANTPDEAKLLEKIRDKMKEYNLDNVF